MSFAVRSGRPRDPRRRDAPLGKAATLPNPPAAFSRTKGHSSLWTPVQKGLLATASLISKGIFRRSKAKPSAVFLCTLFRRLVTRLGSFCTPQDPSARGGCSAHSPNLSCSRLPARGPETFLLSTLSPRTTDGPSAQEERGERHKDHIRQQGRQPDEAQRSG